MPADPDNRSFIEIWHEAALVVEVRYRSGLGVVGRIIGYSVDTPHGVPLLLVFPEMIESFNGTVVRGIYDNAHEFFRGKTFLFARRRKGKILSRRKAVREKHLPVQS